MLVVSRFHCFLLRFAHRFLCMCYHSSLPLLCPLLYPWHTISYSPHNLPPLLASNSLKNWRFCYFGSWRWRLPFNHTPLIFCIAILFICSNTLIWHSRFSGLWRWRLLFEQSWLRFCISLLFICSAHFPLAISGFWVMAFTLRPSLGWLLSFLYSTLYGPHLSTMQSSCGIWV